MSSVGHNSRTYAQLCPLSETKSKEGQDSMASRQFANVFEDHSAAAKVLSDGGIKIVSQDEIKAHS